MQVFRIIEEQLYPYYILGKPDETAKKKWELIHARLSTELGLKELSPRFYSYPSTSMGKSFTQTGFYAWNTVCETFVCARFDGSIDADRFMKERMSFIEIAFRERGEDVAAANKDLPRRILEWENLRGRNRSLSNVSTRKDGNEENWVVAANRKLNEGYQTAVEELNTRMRQANYRLNYHNGFIQIAKDETVEQQIETPFWKVVSDPKWANVDSDMKEAIDRRDSNGRDPAWYAARALESAVQVSGSGHFPSGPSSPTPITFFLLLGLLVVRYCRKLPCQVDHSKVETLALARTAAGVSPPRPAWSLSSLYSSIQAQVIARTSSRFRNNQVLSTSLR